MQMERNDIRERVRLPRGLYGSPNPEWTKPQTLCFCRCCIIHVKWPYFMLELWVHVLYVCGEHDIPYMTRGLSAGGMHLRQMSHRSSGWITANEIICLWEQTAQSRWVYGNAYAVLVSLSGEKHTHIQRAAKTLKNAFMIRRLIDIKTSYLF